VRAQQGQEDVAPGVKKVTFRIGHVAGGRLHMPPWYGKLAFPRAVRLRTAYTRGEAMRAEAVFAGKLSAHPPQQQAARAFSSLRAATWTRARAY